MWWALYLIQLADGLTVIGPIGPNRELLAPSSNGPPAAVKICRPSNLWSSIRIITTLSSPADAWSICPLKWGLNRRCRRKVLLVRSFLMAMRGVDFKWFVSESSIEFPDLELMSLSWASIDFGKIGSLTGSMGSSCLCWQQVCILCSPSLVKFHQKIRALLSW